MHLSLSGDWSGFVFVTNLLNQKEDLPPSLASSFQHHGTAHHHTLVTQGQGQGLAMRWLDMQALITSYGPAPGDLACMSP
jgi:hypothetical protein